jgi:hypothetical protein
MLSLDFLTDKKPKHERRDENPEGNSPSAAQTKNPKANHPSEGDKGPD